MRTGKSWIKFCYTHLLPLECHEWTATSISTCCLMAMRSLS